MCRKCSFFYQEGEQGNKRLKILFLSEIVGHKCLLVIAAITLS